MHTVVNESKNKCFRCIDKMIAIIINGSIKKFKDKFCWQILKNSNLHHQLQKSSFPNYSRSHLVAKGC